MGKEGEDIDSRLQGGVNQTPDSTARALKLKVNFGVFNVNSVQRGLEDELRQTSN